MNSIQEILDMVSTNARDDYFVPENKYNQETPSEKIDIGLIRDEYGKLCWSK